MGSNTSSGLSEILSIGEQVPDVSSLMNPQVNPENGNENVIDGEWSWMSVGTAPDAVNGVLDERNAGRVIERNNYVEEIGDESENLVGLEASVVNLTVLPKRIDCWTPAS